MALSPIAFIAVNYRDFKDYWLKAYEPGTTTPKSMALDDKGDVTVAKLELNADGFLKSAGGALVIPYIEGSYDAWLFPTEAEADANDTVNAKRVADDITGVIDSIVNTTGLVKNFGTISNAAASLKIADGDSLNIRDTTSLGNGNMWDVVPVGTTPGVNLPDGNNIFQSAVTLLCIVKRLHWGDKILSTDSSAIFPDMQTLDIDTIVFITDLFGGTYWRVTNGELIQGYAPSKLTFDDQISLTLGNGNYIFLDIELNKGLIQAKNREATELYFGKIAENNTTVDIKFMGDSIMFGQATASAAGAVNRIGDATNFGDGSVYAQWQFTNNYPQVVEDRLNTVYRGAVTSYNGGFSGDRALDGYLRHRGNPVTGISVVGYGINDCQATTNNGLDNSTVTDITRVFSIPNYTSVLRRFIAREILRGNGVVVVGATNYLSSNGWNGTSADASILCEAWNMAAKAVADEFGLPFVDMRNDVLNQYQLQRINEDGTHPLPAGHDIIGARIASLFIGEGFVNPVIANSCSKILANPTINNMMSKDLTVSSNTKSPNPPFNGNSQSTLLVSVGNPITIPFYLDNDDIICIPSFVCVNGDVQIDLDHGAEQQEYKFDYPIYKDKLVNPVSGTAIANPASTYTISSTGSIDQLIHRRSVNSETVGVNCLHISGKGWHSVTFTLSENGNGTPVCHFFGLEFLTWESMRQGNTPQFELIVDTNDLAFSASQARDIYTTTNGAVAEELLIRIGWEVIPGNSPRYTEYKAIYQGGNIVFSGISDSQYGIDFVTTYTLVWVASGSEGILRLTAGGGAGGEVDIQIYKLNTIYPSVT